MATYTTSSVTTAHGTSSRDWDSVIPDTENERFPQPRGQFDAARACPPARKHDARCPSRLLRCDAKKLRPETKQLIQQLACWLRTKSRSTDR